ncbi:MAG: hypothetical protein V1870_04900, partial [Candidatus Aenigmatarchaeota archaeon]
MDNKIVVLVCVMIGIMVIGVSTVTADAGDFSFSGRIKNSTLGNASGVNISVFGVTQQQNGPPIEILLSNTTSDVSGLFNVTGINNSYSMYSVKLLANDSAGVYTETGPTLPPLPLQALTMGLENSTFYLVPAATLYLYAYNSTDVANISFNYMVMDNSLAYPIKTSMGATGLVENATIAVERNRNYTITIMRDRSAVGDNQSSPPLSTVVTNLSAYTATDYVYSLGRNLSYSFYNLTGLISVSGNASEVKLKDIVVQFTPLSGVVFPNSNVVMGTP